MTDSASIALAWASPDWIDLALGVLLLLVSPAVDLWSYPRLVRRTAAGVPGARARAYLVNIVFQWLLTGGVAIHWWMRGRPWSALWLGAPPPLRLVVGLVFAALVVYMLWAQHRSVVARPKVLPKVEAQLGTARALLPHTAGEWRGFRALAVTAGICEEVLFRGFLLGFAAAWTGLLVAALISSLFFCAAHLYLGPRAALRAGITGAILAALVLAAGSLAPAMIVHAAIDLSSGALAFLALSRPRDPGDAPPAGPPPAGDAGAPTPPGA